MKLALTIALTWLAMNCCAQFNPFPGKGKPSAPIIYAVTNNYAQAGASDFILWSDTTTNDSGLFAIYTSFLQGDWEFAGQTISAGVTNQEISVGEFFSFYAFKVVKHSEFGGESLDSNTWQVPPIHPPTNLVAFWASTSCVTLTFSTNVHAVDWVTGIEVWRNAGSGAGFEFMDSLPPSQTTWDDCNVIAPNSYAYKLRTLNPGGACEQFSNTATSPTVLLDAGDDLLLDAAGNLIEIPSPR